jgi:hypothetical protein
MKPERARPARPAHERGASDAPRARPARPRASRSEPCASGGGASWGPKKARPCLIRDIGAGSKPGPGLVDIVSGLHERSALMKALTETARRRHLRPVLRCTYIQPYGLDGCPIQQSGPPYAQARSAMM